MDDRILVLLEVNKHTKERRGKRKKEEKRWKRRRGRRKEEGRRKREEGRRKERGWSKRKRGRGREEGRGRREEGEGGRKVERGRWRKVEEGGRREEGKGEREERENKYTGRTKSGSIRSKRGKKGDEWERKIVEEEGVAYDNRERGQYLL